MMNLPALLVARRLSLAVSFQLPPLPHFLSSYLTDACFRLYYIIALLDFTLQDLPVASDIDPAA